MRVASVSAWSRRPRAGVANGARWPYVAAALLIASLAAVPAVTAQGGDGDHQDTVGICHFDANKGRTSSAQARETDFYGAGRQGHGEHERDIVPPFVIEDPRAGDPSSFAGRNWDDRGQAILHAGCVEPAPEPEPARARAREEGPDLPRDELETATRTSRTSPRSRTTAT